MARAPAGSFDMNAQKNESLKDRPISVGSKLGPYQVTFELARGGMATVYLARTSGRAGLHRFVALKCIRPDLARDPGFVDMFFDEARIASQIHHPNVCGVLDFDVQGDLYYLALELLSGQTLTKVMRQLHDQPKNAKLFRAGIICRVLADACEGLHAAHELKSPGGEPLNIVHRDVAPDNLFVTYDGGVKVLDFGVASAAQQRHHTQTGMIRGKCSFLSPEVLKGKRVDRRADVWGIGVTAWEMLTHKKLFKGDSDLEVFRSICNGTIPAPSAHCPDLPPALDAIVLKALDRKPDGRYASARELGRALTGFLVENKLAMGPADVAETMAELFPAGRDETRRLFELAQQVESSAAPQAMPGGTLELSAASVKLVPAPPRALALPPSPPRRRLLVRADLPMVLAACSVLLALASLVVSVVSRHPRDDGPRAAPPASTAVKVPSVLPTNNWAGEPYGVEVSRLPADANGDVVLRLRVTAR
jgi:serine/threonine-protein kinase